eukprot:TRINITY_DN5282_c0_g1_i1.p1 TRINITY_DN5282_c0_g1~~TRINITY_DN5282_c0_g1_i1.p1  ORF type:complete len:339 (+),score=54.19 TRINITY_DN5282_c0_g1_i1:710-1726(+)
MSAAGQARARATEAIGKEMDQRREAGTATESDLQIQNECAGGRLLTYRLPQQPASESFLSLPRELQLTVLALRFCRRDLLSVACTCKTFYVLLRDDQTWNHFVAFRFFNSAHRQAVKHRIAQQYAVRTRPMWYYPDWDEELEIELRRTGRAMMKRPKSKATAATPATDATAAVTASAASAAQNTEVETPRHHRPFKSWRHMYRVLEMVRCVECFGEVDTGGKNGSYAARLVVAPVCSTCQRLRNYTVECLTKLQSEYNFPNQDMLPLRHTCAPGAGSTLKRYLLYSDQEQMYRADNFLNHPMRTDTLDQFTYRVAYKTMGSQFRRENQLNTSHPWLLR